MKPNRRPAFDVLLVLLLLLVSAGSALGQPGITNEPQHLAVALGTTATFTVGADGTAPLVYQWQRDLGAGFGDLADRTNSTLVLTNVQSWDAVDYRVIVTDGGGATNSAVAHLYVMSPALLTNSAVIDDFNDNTLTGWFTWDGRATLIETNQQYTVHSYWRGVITRDIIDTIAVTALGQSWSVSDGQTLELRVDLTGMSEHASAAVLEFLNSATDGTYALFKGRDFIHLCKWSASGGHGHFIHDMVPLPNANVVLVLALTPVSPNLILTVRILDRANQDAVLYERSVVDTPAVDRTLTAAEFEAASGMPLNTGSDIPAPPWTSGGCVMLDVWQYNYDGNQPPADVMFDNLEMRTYKLPITRYVDANNATPTPPYTNWVTAATNIQDAVDAASAGDEVVVTNGLYATGGRAVGTNLLVNRVAVDRAITLRSVNGPLVTTIQGYQVPGVRNGDEAVRCVYLTNGASLFGFTLTNGATRAVYGYPTYRESSGGGIWCESQSAVISNCVVAGCFAQEQGGGAYKGTLKSCTVTSNNVTDAYNAFGGGVSKGALSNCVLIGNWANNSGGGAYGYYYGDSTLNNCTLRGNSAAENGGGAVQSTLINCTLSGNSAYFGGGVMYGTLKNCVVYSNTANEWPDYWSCTLDYCCTTPLPSGAGNFTNAPLLVDLVGGNLRLRSNSPCINAGFNAYASGPTDLDDLPRIVSGTADIGAYEYQGSGSQISYAWLQQYGWPTDGSADSLDPDGDGMNNWQEWRCLTDPTSALSVLKLLAPTGDVSGVTVSWQSVTNRSYWLERATNLASAPAFSSVASNLAGQLGTTSYTDTTATNDGPFFYRVGVQQ